MRVAAGVYKCDNAAWARYALSTFLCIVSFFYWLEGKLPYTLTP